jgi:hypothetical protein
MEHFRTNDANGDFWQWCDSELCMIVDRITGKAERIGNWNTVINLCQAREFFERMDNPPDRYIIVRLNCIVPYPVS